MIVKGNTRAGGAAEKTMETGGVVRYDVAECRYVRAG